MTVDVREQISSGAAGTDRGRRPENGWAAFLVVVSSVGLVVLTAGMWYASLPLLGCVELILVIGLGAGLARLRRKDGEPGRSFSFSPHLRDPRR
ncbi:hypothetical protein [Streptacidiphilus jiangxiensis]|uniref:Uncharacterized protein n=1 Tax=Streptacidiphilus jiangxiensis TaxID=235985 RepID=A0A1H7WCB6_STRJI|nr:hypothetical protein [Streptacidiphilus jiangxiensis]SEM19153.1 hypothetical protein SAMN05414137_12068 [Streptacidiphilus jiangxiensis]